ncbi:glycoside hydrolase N-terminal domain-containing protein, partial [Amycolatopsis mediterranei]
MPELPLPPSRRSFLKLGGAVGAGVALGGLRPFTAKADVVRPAGEDLAPPSPAGTLWYPAPASESKIIEQGLPIGNGRIGALVGGDPAADFLYLADASLWTGGANDVLQDDGQFPYETEKFGTLGLLAKLRIAVPAHTGVTDYRRTLDLANGLVVITYRYRGVQYRREYFASHPDDVVVVRLSGGPVTGSVTLEPTRGEPAAGAGAFTGTFANGLKYACTVTTSGGLAFSGSSEVVVVLSGGTNYVPDAAREFLDASLDPLALAKRKAAGALA